MNGPTASVVSDTLCTKCRKWKIQLQTEDLFLLICGVDNYFK